MAQELVPLGLIKEIFWSVVKVVINIILLPFEWWAGLSSVVHNLSFLLLVLLTLLVGWQVWKHRDGWRHVHY